MNISTRLERSVSQQIKSALHWMGATTFIVAYLTADSESLRSIHVYCGYSFGAIFLVRIVWGMIVGGASSIASLWRRAGLIKGLYTDLKAFSLQRLLNWNKWYGALMGVLILVMYVLTPLLVITGIGGYEEWGGKWIRTLFENSHEALSEMYIFIIFVHLILIGVRHMRARWIESHTLVIDPAANRVGTQLPL